MPIDPDTYQQFEQTVEQAKRLGLSLPETLDRQRLLLTKAREKQIRTALATEIYRRFERQSAAALMSHFLDRQAGTPQDMYRAVLEWLELVVNAVADGTLEG